MEGTGSANADRFLYAYYVSFWSAVEVGALPKRSALVERCLACEAVVSRGYRHARCLAIYALYRVC